MFLRFMQEKYRIFMKPIANNYYITLNTFQVNYTGIIF